MTDNLRTKVRAVLLAAVVAASMVVGVVAVPGTAAASQGSTGTVPVDLGPAGSGFYAANTAPDCSAVTYSGSGTDSNPYVIDTVAKLQCMGDSTTTTSLSDDFILTSDIDATGTANWNSGKGFAPVGNGSSPFTGDLDGAGYTITNLTINRSSTDSVGLFGESSSGASIANVTLTNASVTGDDDVGAVVGYSRGTIERVTVTGNVTGNDTVGGIAGRNDGTITSADVSGTVSANPDVNYPSTFGGIAGRNDGTITSADVSGTVSANPGASSASAFGGVAGKSAGTILYSNASVNVTGTHDEAGGLVGYLGDSGVVRQSYATGKLSVDAGNAGGLVGESGGGIVRNGYANVSVSGGSPMGGLVGDLWSDGVVRQSYAVGSVSSGGGLVGDHTGDTVKNSYWDTTTTGQSDAVSSGSGPVTGVRGLPTANMTGTDAPGNMTALDFSALWTTVPGEYPDFAYQSGNGPPLASDDSFTVSADGTSTRAVPGVLAGDADPDDDTLRASVTSGPSNGSLTLNADGSFSYTPDSGFTGVDQFRYAASDGTSADTGTVTLYVSDQVNVDVTTLSGSGTLSNPYVITNASELQAMEDDLGAHYVLGSDIDASGTVAWNQASGFDPVGNDSSPFTGTFDGNNHTITGLTIDRPGSKKVGLFGKVIGGSSGGTSATIADVRLVGVDVTGKGDTGGLVGETEENTSTTPDFHPKIRNVTVKGTVGGGSSTGVGGVVGTAQRGETESSSVYLIANTTANVTVSASGGSVGGLVGESSEPLVINDSAAHGDVTGSGGSIGGLEGQSSSRVLDSYATGNVSGDSNVGGLIGSIDASRSVTGSHATGNVTGNKNVGGLVGRINDDSAVINTSYATGTVDATGKKAGGLVGINRGLLNDTFATGDVNGSAKVGGLVGRNGDSFGDDGNVTDSYAVGRVTSGDASTTGGLVGENNLGTANDSYWDTTTTGQSGAVGTNSDTTSNLNGLTTGEMSGTSATTNMTALDFTNTWNATAGNYPWLAESVLGDVSVRSPLFIGETAQANATLRREDGPTAPASASSFASSNTTVATVDDTGLVTANNTGTAMITATVGGTTGSRTVRVKSGGVIAGTVTDRSDNPVSGLLVQVYQNESLVGADTTNATGYFSVAGPNGSSTVVVPEGPNPGYGFQYVPDVPINVSQTTTRNLTVRKLPGKGLINGTLLDTNGNPVSGVRISAHDPAYTEFDSNTTDANGNFSLRLTAGTYTVRAPGSSARAPVVREDVSVSENQTTDLTLQYVDVGYVNGTVKGASSPVFVVADTDQGFRADVATSRTGYTYNISIQPGTHTVSVYAEGKDAPSKRVSVTAGTNTEANFTLVTTEVVAKSVAITSGPGNGANLGVRANVSQGLLQFQLVDERKAPWPSRDSVGPPGELEGLGVNKSTKFRINLTVTNFTVTSLLWGIDDARWNATQNDSNPNATDITITGSPVTLQANLSQGGGAETGVGPLIRKAPSEVRWPTGQSDQATAGRNQTVYAGVYDLSNVPSAARTTLKGMSATTNAQRFSLPTVENQSLKVWVAAPSLTVDGANHGGFYQATIPDSQLNAWGVTNPVVDLEALYKGQQRDFSVTDTANGARIRIENINYSAGVVEVEPSPSAGQTSGDDTTGGGGDPTPGSSQFTNGQARVSFGTGTGVRSVEVISPGETGRLHVQRLGTSFEHVPEPQTVVIAGMDITAPDPSSGSSTVQITLSDDLLSQHVLSVDQLTIQRYDTESGTWETLETTTTKIDGGVLFEAETDEFSVFTVAEAPSKMRTSTPAPTLTPTPPGTRTTTPATTPAGTTTPASTSTVTTRPGPTTAIEPRATTTPSTTDSGGEGLTPVTALVALTATMLLLRRRR